MNFFPLFEGSFSVNSTKKFIPYKEGIDNPKDRPGSLFIHVQPFLIKTKQDLILIDTGIGHLDADGRPEIFANIASSGFSPTEITKVILSHLHSDHSLGLVKGRDKQQMCLNFPQALHYIQKAEMEISLDTMSPYANSYPHTMLEFFRTHAEIHYLEGDAEIGNGILVELTGGHCPFHQVVLISEGTEILFFGGDVLPEGIQLIRNYIAKYDYDGRKSMELRKAYGTRAALGNWTCLYYHDHHSKPFSKVKKNIDGGFSLVYPE